jgi:radical SAM protein with 4Fe4S-binding SPASM domain
LYNCGAGVSNFHIEPNGILQPCLMTGRYQYDLLSGTFDDGWRNVMPQLREKKVPLGFRCDSCMKQSLCSFCPAFFDWENGAEDAVSDYLCKIGNLRHRSLEETLENALAGTLAEETRGGSNGR